MALVEGKIKSRRWKDQSGQERRVFEIEAYNIVILERRNREKAGESPEPDAQAPPPFEESQEIPDIGGSEEDPF